MKKLYQLKNYNQQNQDEISYEVKILLYQCFELIKIWRFPFLWWLFQQKYQENMMGQGKDSSHLDSTISLLVHTSKLVNLFNDRLVIRSNADPRLGQLNQFHKFMNDWRSESSENNNQFVSSKLWFDLQSMCLGFGSMVAVKQAQFPQSIIKPAIINQDGVENHFCQVRSCNGQNNNPTYLQQESTQNSIRFGQTTISPKSNVGAANEHSSSACSMPTGKRRKTAKTE